MMTSSTPSEGWSERWRTRKRKWLAVAREVVSESASVRRALVGRTLEKWRGEVGVRVCSTVSTSRLGGPHLLAPVLRGGRERYLKGPLLQCLLPLGR
jgi:hypothetical protein